MSVKKEVSSGSIGTVATQGKSNVPATGAALKIPANPNRSVFRAIIDPQAIAANDVLVCWGITDNPVSDGAPFAFADPNQAGCVLVNLDMETTFKGDLYFKMTSGGPALMYWIDEE